MVNLFKNVGPLVDAQSAEDRNRTQKRVDEELKKQEKLTEPRIATTVEQITKEMEKRH